MSRHDRKGHLPPFVPLLKDTLKSPAWRAMSHGAKALYVCLKARYSFTLHNNGRLFLSQRTTHREMRSGYTEITRWFRELQHYGFIVQTKGGSLGLNGKGTAPHWRLTECGYMNDPPTRDFGRWDGTKFKDCVNHRHLPQKQNPATENRSTPLRKTVAPPLRKTVAPSGTSATENRSMVEPPTATENRSISSLPLPSGERDLWRDLDIPACLRRRV
jgi:hypothetical protein